MKNKTLKILFSFFLLTLVLFSWQSCNTEFDYDNILSTRNDATEQANQPNFTIEEVQSWYGTINNKTTNRPQKVKGIKSVEDLFYSEPDWNNYCTNETKNYSVIDIDLTLQMQNDLFLDEHKEAYDKNPDWRYLHSYTRMVVLKSKKQDKKIGFLMTLIPSVEYIKNHKDKIRKTTYVKREKDYDGYILFHELNGTFANGWKYKDGKITAAIKEHSGNTDNNNSLIRLWNTQASYTLAKPHKTSIRRVKRNSEEELDGGELKEVVVIGKKKKDPWDDTTSRWLEEDWNNLNRPGVGNNDFPYPENSNSGGGGGGGTGGYINWYFTSPEPKEEKMAKANLKRTMPKQLPNTCVTSIMEYINHQLCGGNVNEGAYFLDYWKWTGENIGNNGVSIQKIIPFVERHFNTEKFTSYKDAVDSGNFVMTSVKSELPNSVHNVVIVGYKQGTSTSYIYMDPELGTFQEAPISNFSNFYNINISSCKQ